MVEPPIEVGGATCLAWADLTSRDATGFTRHGVDGTDVTGTFAGLAICAYDGSDEYYLFYCDAGWETITDTWHETMQDALDQAAAEYGDALEWHHRQPPGD